MTMDLLNTPLYTLFDIYLINKMEKKVAHGETKRAIQG